MCLLTKRGRPLLHLTRGAGASLSGGLNRLDPNLGIIHYLRGINDKNQHAVPEQVNKRNMMDIKIYEAIFDSINCPIVFVDNNHFIRYLNKGAKIRYYERRALD